ncbi:MAG: hypothetical protein JW891_02505 [Candidatus Lokiarchaeota archaeon]|nr:hypothetical protein [Candidatus Lokiarchaeota archaeon]
MNSKHKLEVLLFLEFLTICILIPTVRANPVFVSYEYFINLGYGFLFLVVIPLTFLITSLIEFIVYCCSMLKIMNNFRFLLVTALFINLITVPITQWIAYLNNLYLLTDLWKYFIIETLVILIEYVIFKQETNSVVEGRFTKQKMFGTIILANIVSFLVGFGFFNFFYPIISNLSKQPIQVEQYFISLLHLVLFLTLITCMICITYLFYKCEKKKYGEAKNTFSCCCILILIVLVIGFLLQPATTYYILN